MSQIDNTSYTRFPRLWEKVHIIYQDGTEHTAESFKLDWNNPNIKEFKVVEGGHEPRE